MDGAHNEVPRLRPDGTFAHIIEVSSAQVGGHNDDRVPKVDDSALSVRETSIIQDLQEQCDEFSRGFLNLVDENDAVRLATDVFGELASAVVTDVAWGSTDEAGDGVLLRVLRGVDSDHGVGRVEQDRRELKYYVSFPSPKILQESKLTVLLSNVLPVPEGPAIKKLAMGLWAFRRPLLERRIAFATALTASGWPTTLSAKTFSILRSLSFSEESSLVTGMEVQRPTISAIWSGVTVSLP